jgi:cysteine desulfurase
LRKPFEALNTGGGQEGGVRPGTENVAGAIGLAEALEARANPETVRAEHAAASSRLKTLAASLRKLDRCTFIPADREDEDPRFSPYVLQAAFKGIPGQVMARALDDAGFAVSTGSACSSGKQSRPVLDAMGIDAETASFGIRISQGWTTTEDDIEALGEAIKKILATL